MYKTEDNIILIDKPFGISSFGVVSKKKWELRQLFGKKVKVGHTGTLDPFATGLMIVVTGKMTKRAMEFTKHDKTYQAKIVLGKTTSTLDPEGLQKFGAKFQPSIKQIEAVLTQFKGKITQIPPIFSAIKINGQRAYDIARKGGKVDIPQRTITIYDIKVLSYNYPVLEIEADVSSGTYIRTLAQDIGAKLGVNAYCASLRRTRVGKFDVKDAEKLTTC